MGGVDQIYLAYDSGKWLAVMNIAMKFLAP